MANKHLKSNIAAVSLIEIMMIFAIIGIVTTACMTLAHPKYQYMNKIKLYTAFSMLEDAGNILAQEGHLDFTTDVNICAEFSGAKCLDYSGKYPNLSNQLPKAAFRDTLGISGTTETDPGLDITSYASIAGTNAAERQQNFKYLQSGLCQRLAKVMNVTTSNINCAVNADDATSINEANGQALGNNYQQSFWGIRQDLTLPNGMVLYISNKLYNSSFNGSSMPITNKRNVNISTLLEYEHKLAKPTESDMNTMAYYWKQRNPVMFTCFPNESRLESLRHVNKYCTKNPSTTYCSGLTDYYKYLEKAYSKNKDFFIIYVDTNCKMTSENDKHCGPDQLNQDVFAFRMYRDGTVIPDYRSGFPKNALTAKVLTQEQGWNNRYAQYTFRQGDIGYAVVPIVYARCYANLMGTYYSGYATDVFKICSDDDVERQPLSDCVTTASESVCKAVINKPSFVMR